MTNHRYPRNRNRNMRDNSPHGERYEQRGYGRGYGRPTMNRSDDFDVDYDRNDRDFFDRAGDEVMSWFGDERAEARRRLDERYGHDGRGYVNREFAFEGGLLNTRDNGYTRPYDQRDYDRRPRMSDSFDRSDRYDYDRAYGQGRMNRAMTQQEFTSVDSDYDNWRSRQIDQLDRDYMEWRQENQSRFDSEFSQWRDKRNNQREMLRQIDEHAEVIGSDGEFVGKVDKIRGERIILTKDDSPDNMHHSLKANCLDEIEDGKVKLCIPSSEAKQQWRDEERVMESDSQSIDNRRFAESS